MVRLAVYGGISTFLSFSIVAAAFRQRSNFYAACIYLSKSSACMMILMNMGFFLMIVFGQILQTIFFGQLRPVEIEHLYERAWYAVSETCLAMTIFRDEFDTRFFVTFTTLLFLKIFHWLCQDRVEFMEQSPTVPMSFHVRMIALMEILCAVDAILVLHAVDVTIKKGPSMMIMFAFEYSILGATIISTFCKYVLNVIDMRSEEAWENKSIYVFYLEIVTDFFKLITYLIFFAIIMIFYGLPLHIIRDVYVTMRSFLTKCGDLVRYRRATRNMNERYPNATNEELERLSDRTCIICREEMVIAAANVNDGNNNRQAGNAAEPRPTPAPGSGDTPKKLPCGHIFHFHCLRSWLERQQSCPTCRRPVLSEAQPTQPAQQARPLQNQNNGLQQPPQPHAPPHPGFMQNPIPMYMFPNLAFQNPWAGAPIPMPNANLQQNGDNVSEASTSQQASPSSSGERVTNDDTTTAAQQSTSSASSSSSSSSRSTPPTVQQPPPATSNLTSASPHINATFPSSMQPQIPITSPFNPCYPQYLMHYPSGLIPLFPILPTANVGNVANNGSATSTTSTVLDHLTEEQIRLLETSTREALSERLRILHTTQGQISDIITLLTQAVSAFPPQTSPSDNIATATTESSDMITGQSLAAASKTTKTTSDSLPIVAGPSSTEDASDKKGKGKSVLIPPPSLDGAHEH